MPIFSNLSLFSTTEVPAVAQLLLALGILLLVARSLGELARYFGQPSVLGESLAGILLGPALLGRVAPDIAERLFPTSGTTAVMLDGLCMLSVTLFLLVAGLEVDLSRMKQRGRAALTVAFFAFIVPLVIGVSIARLAPAAVGFDGRASLTVFALFIGTAFTISALPIVARTLMDLGLYKSDFGMVVMAAAILNDLAGWVVLAVLLGVHEGGDGTADAWRIALLAVGFAFAMLTVGRWIVHRALPWVQAHTAWPGGVIVFSISFALCSAAVTEWIGIHAIFGAFLAGIALGDSAHLRERTRSTVGEFVTSFFAPLFFALIGLRIDFVTHFDWVVVLVVLVMACVGKVLGAGIGARFAEVSPRESVAMGFALNARGSMGIILGLTAFQNGLISERLMVALVVMSIATAILAGPGIERALSRRKPVRFARALKSESFVVALADRDERSVIHELAQAAARATGLSATDIETSVAPRVAAEPPADVAVHCARIAGIEWPRVALGVSRAGVSQAGSTHDGAHLVFLVLTPRDKPETEAEILADIESTLSSAELRTKILAVTSYTELLALLRADGAAR